MPTPGALSPIQRVPSGLPGPGRDGLGTRRPRILGRREPPRVLLLDDDLEVAERRRPRRLPGGHREDAHEVGAVVEVEAVDPAVDHDHRLGRRRGGRERLHRRDDHGARRRSTIACSIIIRVGNRRRARPGCECVKNGRLWRRSSVPSTGARYGLPRQLLHPLGDALRGERRRERDGRVRRSGERGLHRGGEVERRPEVVRRDRDAVVAHLHSDRSEVRLLAPPPSPGRRSAR